MPSRQRPSVLVDFFNPVVSNLSNRNTWTWPNTHCTTWGIPQQLTLFARIMHQHAQLADLVDVLAVDFEIVDGLGDARKRY